MTTSLYYRIGIFSLALIGLIVGFAVIYLSHDTPTISNLDTPGDEVITTSTVTMSGWTLDSEGVEKVEIVLDGNRRLPANYGIARKDVTAAHPSFPDSVRAGFEFSQDLKAYIFGNHRIEVLVTDRRGNTTVIGKRHLLAQGAMDTWKALLEQRGHADADIFYILFSTSGIEKGGADQIDSLYRPYLSATMKVGIRVPILYMRTTKGARHGWEFDPDFPTTITCHNGKPLADDSLQALIDHAVQHQLPVLFTLNGGIWADANCDAPDWDLNDHLEADPQNSQWNEKNQVMPDDYLKGLPGSAASPELARSLTYNVYATKVRSFKKRNLQAAAKKIKDFADHHPDLFVGVNLDPDLYLNPFFEREQWYDYNPDTLRQFREWLQGSGPYSGQAIKDIPDLSAYRRHQPLTLEQVNHISARQVHSWEAVDPPRSFSLLRMFWRDPWVREWELFRRHLVDLHYDELSRWLLETGIEKRFVYSSQGFAAPGLGAMPFAISLDSPVKNYDSGGMTIEGSVPANGHLGAILYGPSALNSIRMESQNSLFETFAQLDPDWAVVEFNTADLRKPQRLPGFAEGYQSLRDLFSHGARFVAPMAWNGSNGSNAGQPGFVAYTALRNTPLEDSIRDFLVSHAYLPRRTLLWSFGGNDRNDMEGWQLNRSGKWLGLAGLVTPKSEAGLQKIELISPATPKVSIRNYDSLIIGVSDREDIETLQVYARPDTSGPWTAVSGNLGANQITHDAAGLRIPLQPTTDFTVIGQFRIMITFRQAISFRLQHIALYPKKANQMNLGFNTEAPE